MLTLAQVYHLPYHPITLHGIFYIVHPPNKPIRIYKQRFDYNHANWEDLNQFLTQYNFTSALNSDNSEFIWNYLKTAINSALNMFVPKIPIKESNLPIQLSVIKLSVFVLQKGNLRETPLLHC